MAALFAQLQGDQVVARKAHDKALTLVLGTVLSESKNRGLELTRELTDDDVVEVLRRGIKRRRESAEMYIKGARADLAGIELAKIMPLFKGKVEGGVINAIAREELARAG